VVQLGSSTGAKANSKTGAVQSKTGQSATARTSVLRSRSHFTPPFRHALWEFQLALRSRFKASWNDSGSSDGAVVQARLSRGNAFFLGIKLVLLK